MKRKLQTFTFWISLVSVLFFLGYFTTAAADFIICEKGNFSAYNASAIAADPWSWFIFGGLSAGVAALLLNNALHRKDEKARKAALAAAQKETDGE